MAVPGEMHKHSNGCEQAARGREKMEKVRGRECTVFVQTLILPTPGVAETDRFLPLHETVVSKQPPGEAGVNSFKGKRNLENNILKVVWQGTGAVGNGQGSRAGSS